MARFSYYDNRARERSPFQAPHVFTKIAGGHFKELEESICLWLAENAGGDASPLGKGADFRGEHAYWWNGIFLLTFQDELAFAFRMRWC